MDKDWGAEGVQPCKDGGEHNFCWDCCCHGACTACGAEDPYFDGCALGD